MSDVGFVKIIIIWCLRLPIGRRRVKSIREDWLVSPNLHQIGILRFSQLVLKIGGIDLDLIIWPFLLKIGIQRRFCTMIKVGQGVLHVPNVLLFASEMVGGMGMVLFCWPVPSSTWHWFQHVSLEGACQLYLLQFFETWVWDTVLSRTRRVFHYTGWAFQMSFHDVNSQMVYKTRPEHLICSIFCVKNKMISASLMQSCHLILTQWNIFFASA